RLTRGWNGVIDLELRRDRDELYNHALPGVHSTVPPNDLRLPGLSEIILLDIPLLLDADDAKASGFYWGVVGSGAGWRGADFLRGTAPTGPFENVSPQGAELTLGAADVLPAPPAGYDSLDDWDIASVLRVTLRR